MAAAAPRARLSSRDRLERALIVVFVAGFYLHHNLFLTETVFIPTYLATLAGLALLVLNAHRLPSDLLGFALTVTAIALASILLNPVFWTDWAGSFGTDYAKAFVVFLSAVLASMGACVGLLHTPPCVLRRMLWVVVYVIVIGALLDVTVPPLRTLFEQVSAPFLRTGFQYLNEVRDVNMYGTLRPKFLTSEPSNVSIFLVFAFTLLHLLVKQDPSRFARLHFWGAFTVALLIVRGPTMVLVPMFALLFARSGITVIVLAMAVALFAVLVIVLDPDLSAALARSRIGWVLEGNDRSFFVRQVLPVEVAWATIWKYPLFGIGFGGKGAAQPIALELFWEAAKRADWVFEEAEPLGGNGFWIIWTQLGLVGAPLFIWALVSFARTMTAWWLPALITIALFFINGGAPNTIRVWSFTFILLGVCHVLRPAAQMARRVRAASPGPGHAAAHGAGAAAFARARQPNNFGTRVPS